VIRYNDEVEVTVWWSEKDFFDFGLSSLAQLSRYEYHHAYVEPFLETFSQTKEKERRHVKK